MVASKKDLGLMTLAQVNMMDVARTKELYARHFNKGLSKMLDMLGFADVRPVSAEGTRINLSDGTSILDFTSGIGVLNHGHNHPRILAARKMFAESGQMEVWKLFPSPYQAALCYNLSRIFPQDLEVVFLCNSGAEANEGALKMAEKFGGPKRDKIVFTDISFHGKSHATLSVSGSEMHDNRHFKTLPGCIQVPYGDADTLAKAFADNRNIDGSSKVSAFIVESIRAEGIVSPPEGYFDKVRTLCDKYGVTLIVDEIWTGFGRTGKLFAFEHQNYVPDIVTFSKSFGGGKATVAGYIARRGIFDKTYGSMGDATLHSTTFSGFGEEMVSAIEAINVIFDEELVENSAKQGTYLLEKLNEIKNRHPGIVKDVRGKGLLTGIRLQNLTTKVVKTIPGMNFPTSTIEKITSGAIMSKLLEKHRVLTFTPPHDVSFLTIAPPLIVTREEIDEFIAALDDVLSTNLIEAVTRFAKRAVKG